MGGFSIGIGLVSLDCAGIWIYVFYCWAGLQVYTCWLEESLICDKSLVYQFLEDLIKCCGWF